MKGIKSRLVSLTIAAILAVSSLAVLSCRPKKEKMNEPANIREEVKDPLIKANRHLLEAEDLMIDDFIKRYNWNLQKTSSGLRYLIYQKGTGEVVKVGDQVTIQFESKLLDGTLCYTSKEEGPKTFILGKAQIEKGLEEGILLLKVGDRAKFVLPSHLAFGLVGDHGKIPTRSALVYDIEVVSSFPIKN